MSPRKRSKTFTGCFTCRSRKIRCDVKKPLCDNCTRSGLICSGYDINLKWSVPVQFYFRGKDSYSSLIKHIKVKDREEEPDTSEFFQRRNVGFVIWDAEKNCRPYESYDEMDRDLNILNNSGRDRHVHREGKTKLIGPFGVFKSKKRQRTEENEPDAPEPKPRKNRVAEAQDQLWLSNELRDDALLTAAALNGDSQFLDFMDSLSPVATPKLHQTYNTNQNDFLNLVFHRNHTFQNDDEPVVNDDAIVADTANQHGYYSNYNNNYYNNPYQLNENLEIHLHASKLHRDEDVDIVDGDNSSSTRMPSSIMGIVQSPFQPKLGVDLALPNVTVGIPTTALQVQPLTRYLLNYYITLVADLMTVIPLTENPWKTIYFPRALMAIGELLALGKTSTAKNALLNALLAVSAFNLQSKFPKNSEAMKYYLNLGIRLRNQALLFVKQLLNSKNETQSGVEYCVAHEKYKDVLCAVMTMISVDLVWGTMQDTNFYIKWCGRVIATKMVNKKKLSPKARILHRIFLSLKLIQDSTCLDLENVKVDFENKNELYDVNGDKFGNQKGRIDFIVNDSFKSKNTSPSFVDKKLINTKDSDENFATDALYGLPNSLILLFSETVQLLRTKIYHQEVYHTLPDNFTQRVNILNKKLLNWKLDWKLYKEHDDEDTETVLEIDEDLKDEALQNVEVEAESDSKKTFFSPMHETTYHHILSFYHALMIYFNRLIKEISTKKLQTKVAKTLHHLNAIQRLITEGEAAIIPLFWQGFIAGCEATSLNLQMGFKKWGADIAQYLGSYWGARQIMLEVWRRRRMNEAKDDWVSVIQDWEMNLMLN